jgi:hypothetical protein
MFRPVQAMVLEVVALLNIYLDGESEISRALKVRRCLAVDVLLYINKRQTPPTPAYAQFYNTHYR